MHYFIAASIIQNHHSKHLQSFGWMARNGLMKHQ
jgi:hypothetical protein